MSRLITEELEPYYTVQEVAAALKLHADTVRRLVEDLPGVLHISHPRLIGRRKRTPRVTLRIPRSALEQLQQNRSAGTALKVEPRRGVI